MGTLEDRNRESVKRDDPKDKDKHGVPQREGEGASDKYSREGQGKSGKPGEESNPDGSERGSGSHRDRSADDMEDRS